MLIDKPIVCPKHRLIIVKNQCCGIAAWTFEFKYFHADSFTENSEGAVGVFELFFNLRKRYPSAITDAVASI
ncbi:hypothetical protein D9M71_721200 [compost metagenome]